MLGRMPRPLRLALAHLALGALLILPACEGVPVARPFSVIRAWTLPDPLAALDISEDGQSVLLGSASAIAEPSPGSDLSGVYACEGTNPDGSAYTAVVEIVKRQDTYLVRWTQENEEQVMGVGIQQDGVLAVSYFGGAPAIVVYSLATEGRLTGQWTMGGAGRLFKETLTKVSAVDVDTKPAKPARPAKPASRPASAPGSISI